MRKSMGGYVVRLILDRRTIAIKEVSVTDTHRHLGIEIDGVGLGAVSVLRSYVLGLAIGRQEIVLWTGPRVFVVSLARTKLARFDLPDEVHQAYWVSDSKWLLVCDSSVLAFDSVLGTCVTTYFHDEVIVRSWWEGERLLAEDLRGRFLELGVDLAVGRA